MHGSDFSKFTEIGIDDASVMTGINDGPHQRLKDEPFPVLVRYLCHSLQLATSYALSETLPRNLDIFWRLKHPIGSINQVLDSRHTIGFSI